jgi:hypothetical protein
MHDRAGGYRVLPTAIGALVGEGFGLLQPGAAPRRNPGRQTRPANKPVRPTAREKVFRAHAFRRKAVRKLEQRSWKPTLRCKDDTHPAQSNTDEQLILEFLFYTLDLDSLDVRA